MIFRLLLSFFQLPSVLLSLLIQNNEFFIASNSHTLLDDIDKGIFSFNNNDLDSWNTNYYIVVINAFLIFLSLLSYFLISTKNKERMVLENERQVV